MSVRIVFVLSLVLVFGAVAAGNSVQAENEPAGAEATRDSRNERTDWDRFQVESRTRFGRMPLYRMPEYLDQPDSRFGGGARFGRNNTFRGIDGDAPGSRFRQASEPEPLLPSDYLSETASRPPEPAAAPASADVAGPQSQPIRRRPGFLQQPDRRGVFARPEPAELLSEENLGRTPLEQRWFRDIGRRNVLPGLGSVDRRTDPAQGGLAVAVGGEEMLRGTEQNAAPAQPEPANPAVDVARQRRRFEQQLEGMLLTDASVHFLSPVQVSFQDGIATVRGVVPAHPYKVAAGNVLLTVPAVKQVNNLISVIEVDPARNPQPIEVP